MSLERAGSTRSGSDSFRVKRSPEALSTNAASGSWIFLYPSGDAGTSKASQAFWQVEDLEAEVAELRKRGVVFEEYDLPGMKTVNGILTAGGSKAAWFKDTEGNIMAVIQTVLNGS